MNTDSGTSRKEARIAELDRIIQTEDAKPDPDYQLIDDCIREIGELEGAKVDFSKEEVAKATGKILRKAEREKKRKRIVRYAAAAAAVVVLGGGVTACTVNPTIINWLIRIANLPLGTKINDDSITYTNNGELTDFRSVNDLQLTENISLYYPKIMEENLELLRIKRIVMNGSVGYRFFYDNSDYLMTIYTNPPANMQSNGEEEIVITEIGQFSVYERGEHLSAFGIIDDLWYYVSCPNREDMNSILLSFERKG